MKKLGFIWLLLPMAVFAQEIVHTNQITIEWDAVTTLRNGDPIPAGDVISYQVSIAEDPQFPDQAIGETGELYLDYILPSEGTFIIGVRTVRNPGVDESLSTWNCMIVEYIEIPESPLSTRIRR